CYCIDHYLSGNLAEATNISEIACSRLKDIVAGTRDMKFHATIPIITNGQKVGIINLLSREKQQLDDPQLYLLNTLSELIGIAIQRTRLQEVYVKKQTGGSNAIHDFLKRVVVARMEELAKVLQNSAAHLQENQSAQALTDIQQALEQAEELKAQIALVLNETSVAVNSKTTERNIRYPASPLTPRELEVLGLVKKGHTNNQIAKQLYIAERTVKFHITSILSKLYAKTRTQAVDIALKRGLLSS
ncbi:MAG: LuxR C-terminal-related transcriptional regulator, partial [Saprospiraceae bacterium]